MPYGEAWESGELTDESREAFYQAALARRESAERDQRDKGKLGLLVGASGALAGLLGVAAAFLVYMKTPVQPPPGYITIDSSTGWIDQPVAAKDAPKLFSEAVRQRALRDFIIACTSYVPQTWARVDWHACMIQATEAEQKRLAADIGKGGADYPPAVFGADGWAMPTAFTAMVKLGETGKAPSVTYHYEVRYQRTESVNARQIKPVAYTAQITFSFHPEMKMSKQDRLINPSGFQADSFSTVKD